MTLPLLGRDVLAEPVHRVVRASRRPGPGRRGRADGRPRSGRGCAASWPRSRLGPSPRRARSTASVVASQDRHGVLAVDDHAGHAVRRGPVGDVSVSGSGPRSGRRGPSRCSRRPRRRAASTPTPGCAASCQVPRAAAPSPKKTTVTRSSPSSWEPSGGAGAHARSSSRACRPGPSTPCSASAKWTVPPPLPRGAARGAPEQVAEEGGEVHPLGEGVAQAAVRVVEVVVRVASPRSRRPGGPPARCPGARSRRSPRSRRGCGSAAPRTGS